MPIDWAVLRDRVRRTAGRDGTPGAPSHADAEIDACLERALAELSRWWPPSPSPAGGGPAAFATAERAASAATRSLAGLSSPARDRREFPLAGATLSNDQVEVLVMGATAYLELESCEAFACAAPAHLAAARARRTAFGQLLRHFGGRLAN